MHIYIIFIHSFIWPSNQWRRQGWCHPEVIVAQTNFAISIAPLQVLYHSDALPTTARILYRSFTPKATVGKRLVQGPYVAARAGVEHHDPPVESHRLNQGATTFMRSLSMN